MSIYTNRELKEPVDSSMPEEPVPPNEPMTPGHTPKGIQDHSDDPDAIDIYC